MATLRLFVLAGLRSEGFQIFGGDRDGRGLADKVQAQQNGGGAVAIFDAAFHAAQGAVLDPHPAAGADFGGEENFQLALERAQDFGELAPEEVLVEDVEQIGDVIALEDFGFLVGEQMEEDVAGEEGLGERGGFAAVAMDGGDKRERGGDAFAGAKVVEFFFAARLGVRHVPCLFNHGLSVLQSAGASTAREHWGDAYFCTRVLPTAYRDGSYGKIKKCPDNQRARERLW